MKNLIKFVLVVVLSLISQSVLAALTLTSLSHENAGSQSKVEFVATFDSSYDSGGEALIAKSLGLHKINRVVAQVTGGYLFEYDYTNHKVLVYNGGMDAHTHAFTGTALAARVISVIDDNTAATNGTKLYLATDDYFDTEGVFFSENAGGVDTRVEATTGTLGTTVFYAPLDDEVIEVTDDDTAATNGTAVYVRPAGYGNRAILVSANAGSDNSSFVTVASGDTVPVYYDSAPTMASSVLYFDEDGTVGDRFLTVSPTGGNLYFQSQEGRWLKVTHNASAAALGVQVYFDDDGVDTDDRLVFVSPTDASGTNTNVSYLAYSEVEDITLVPVYFDEDGASAIGLRLLHAGDSTADIRVAFVDYNDIDTKSRILNVTYSASAASSGVQVYFDDDAVGIAEKFLFVSPTNVNGTANLSQTFTYYGAVASGDNDTSSAAVADQVTASTDLSSLAVRMEVYGDK